MEKRPTSAVIDTGALKYNYARIKEKLSKDTKIMAVVKANAYGHGDIEVARILEPLGCEYFGVAIPEEGAKLRVGGILKPIVVLGGFYPGQIKEVFDLDLTPVVYDMDAARLLNEYGRKKGLAKKIHVKIDTGMGRLGVLPEQVLSFFEGLKALGSLKVEGLLTHFSESDSEDLSFSKKQVEGFITAIDIVKRLGFAPELIDMANSAATVGINDSHFNLVRPGIMLYGSYPAAHFRKVIDLKPVMEIKTRILHLKKVPAGFSVSYGRTFVTKKESVIATLPIGYADGLPRRLSGCGEFLIRGKRAPVLGRVCMDLTMCDVTDIEGAQVGDEAVVIGRQGEEIITAEEVAAKAGTISYEIFCNISARVPRIYI